MFVLPRGTLVKVGGLPFRLLQDVETDGSKVNYKLALSHAEATVDTARQAESPFSILQTSRESS